LTQLPHLKCIRFGSVRSSHPSFKMHKVVYVHLSLPILMHVWSIATQKNNNAFKCEKPLARSACFKCIANLNFQKQRVTRFKYDVTFDIRYTVLSISDEQNKI